MGKVQPEKLVRIVLCKPISVGTLTVLVIFTFYDEIVDHIAPLTSFATYLRQRTGGGGSHAESAAVSSVEERWRCRVSLVGPSDDWFRELT